MMEELAKVVFDMLSKVGTQTGLFRLKSSTVFK